MLVSIHSKSRGLAGRPLVALLVAVGAGISEHYVGSWLHLSEALTSVVVVGTVALVAYIWHRWDEPK